MRLQILETKVNKSRLAEFESHINFCIYGCVYVGGVIRTIIFSACVALEKIMCLLKEVDDA